MIHIYRATRYPDHDNFIFQTTEDERDIEIRFAEPLPENTMEKLQEAKMKKELGIPAEKIIKELGY